MSSTDTPATAGTPEASPRPGIVDTLIALDTSSEIGSVALYRDGRVVAEHTWHVGQNHTAETLPTLDYLLDKVTQHEKPHAGQKAVAQAESSAGKIALRAVVVAIGPGSFNGLRAGIALAKGLAFAASVPIVGVGTLEVAAYAQSATDWPICALQPAGHGEVAAALYQMVGGVWTEKMAPEILTLDALLARMERPTLFCGEPSPLDMATIVDRLGGQARIASPAALVRRAGFLAELGERRLESGQVDDIATLQPLYLRRPPITRPRSGLRGFH